MFLDGPSHDRFSAETIERANALVDRICRAHGLPLPHKNFDGTGISRESGRYDFSTHTVTLVPPRLIKYGDQHVEEVLRHELEHMVQSKFMAAAKIRFPDRYAAIDISQVVMSAAQAMGLDKDENAVMAGEILCRSFEAAELGAFYLMCGRPEGMKLYGGAIMELAARVEQCDIVLENESLPAEERETVELDRQNLIEKIADKFLDPTDLEIYDR